MTSSLRKVRDSQRIRVYRANTGVLGANYPSMDDVKNFCEYVLKTDLWRELFPNENAWVLPKLKPGKGAKTAHVLWHYDGRIEIAFPKAYRYATYIIHELTHYGIGMREDLAAHGPEFVGLFLTLVDEFCSPRTSKALRRAMAKHNVRVYVPHRSYSRLEEPQIVLEDEKIDLVKKEVNEKQEHERIIAIQKQIREKLKIEQGTLF